MGNGSAAPGERYYRKAPRYYREGPGTSAAAAKTRTCLTESGTSAGAVLPLPLAVLPQGRKVLAYEERG